MNRQNLEYIKKYLKEDKLAIGIEQLKQGISPQYIVGNVDFYGNIFQVDKRVLIPRFETELLVEKTIVKVKEKLTDSVRILDIGTGSGCIAITLSKELLNSQVVGVDISDDALNVARQNAMLNEADVDFLKSDVFSDVEGKFDVIISNPPYIREDEEIEDIVRLNEPHLALYASDEGLYFYDKILRECSNYLNLEFLIAFEIGCEQGEAVKSIALKYLDNVEIEIEKDYSNRDRFVFIFKN